jgi:tetratricopeptide (TPR) repeat protein
MANVEQKLGNFQKALELYKKSLEIKIKCLGDSHVSVAMTLGNMALVHSALGQKDEAVIKSSQAHKIFLDNLGPNHPSTLLEARNLSRLS